MTAMRWARSRNLCCILYSSQPPSTTVFASTLLSDQHVNKRNKHSATNPIAALAGDMDMAKMVDLSHTCIHHRQQCQDHDKLWYDLENTQVKTQG